MDETWWKCSSSYARHIILEVWSKKLKISITTRVINVFNLCNVRGDASWFFSGTCFSGHPVECRFMLSSNYGRPLHQYYKMMKQYYTHY